MSKYRCPICGATHKQQPDKCRLCGQNMADESALPTNRGTTARVQTKEKKGLGGLVLIGAGIVLVIGLLALGLGFAPGNTWVDKVRDKIPGLSSHNDGWQTTDVADGRFTTQMPGQPENSYLALASANDGRVTQVVARLGNETLLSVSYGEVTKAPGESDKAALQRLADEWATQTGMHIEKRTETTYAGYPALVIDSKGQRADGTTAYQRSLLVLRGTELVVIQSLSIYEDQPQFSKLANGVTFTS